MSTGIIGVSLSIRERLSAWPFFILCYLAYIYISLRSGYYAFSVMNTLFAIVALYGWYKWSGATNPGATASSLRITRLPRKAWPRMLALIAAGTAIIGLILSRMEDARLPFWDACATSNGLMAQWLLSRKHIENWIFWIIADIIYLTFFLKDGLWPSAFLFGIFTLLACKGWHDWKVKSEK